MIKRSSSEEEFYSPFNLEQQTKMLNLPFEDILCRLPVKPLKRFRCVAKSWRSLIDSNRFIKLHFNTNSHSHLIVGCKDLVFTLDFDNNDPLKATVSAVKPPFSNSMDDISISCNGLFLVSGCNNLLLWNPFTRECKNLPGVGDELECRNSNVSYGFAYDSRNDDYKVVRVVEYKDALHQFASTAHIYGLKSNSWTKTKNFIYPVPRMIKTDVNGMLHTLLIKCSQREGERFTANIKGFSIENERHYDVELPLRIWKKGVALSLNKIGGCLSVNRISESKFEIWVMKDYGVRESWTKILSVQVSLNINQLDDMSSIMKPLVYSKDGHKVLLYLGYNIFSWRGLRNKTSDYVPVTDLPFTVIFVEPCVESMVSLIHSEQQVLNKAHTAKHREMATLPFEVVENILCRLPVKPLKRFRCVAKSWRLLIDSGRFIKSHLKRSLETDSHRHLVGGVKGEKDMFTVDLDVDDSANDNRAKAIVTKLPRSSGVVDIISNSCNGLFLIVGEPLIMWNPFTREFKHLPRMRGDGCLPAPPLGCYSRVAYGFAYDSRNDDYKVVGVVEHRVIMNHTWITSPQAHIYSLKSNSWRQIANFTYEVPDLIYPDVNGALHTMIDTTGENPNDPPAKMTAFSVENERHYEVKLPLGIWSGNVVGLMPHKVGGCLSLNYISESGITIWVMKDYGVRESWIKMLSVPNGPTMNELELNTMKPLVYTYDGYKVLLFLGASFFLWHDLRNQPVKHVSFEGFPLVLDYIEVCVESLVSFPSEQVQKKQVQQDIKDKKKSRNKSDDFLSRGFKLVL